MQYTVDIDGLKILASEFISILQPPCVVALFGGLGGGKTTFVKHAISSLPDLKDVDVLSPTFALVHTYDAICGKIWHGDLYRIKSIFEIEELGLLEAMHEDICFIEWADRIQNILPKKRIDIFFEIVDDKHRLITIEHYQ